MKTFNLGLSSHISALAIVAGMGLCFGSSGAFAHTVVKNHKKTLCLFLPKNDLKIRVSLNQQGGINEATFNKVIDQVSKYYEPIIKKLGGKLKVNRLWKDSTVNASAERDGSTYIVNMYGGLARHHITNADGFTLVMCHEVGHHLGGFPIIEGDDWASNEGQADYFATMKCFRRINEKQNNSARMARMGDAQVPAIVKERCSVQFKSPTEIALCARNSVAGMNLALLLWDLANSSATRSFFKGPGQRLMGANRAKPDYATPDSSQVSHTNDEHPAAQCRLDTYFSGSVCGISYREDFSRDNPVPGACSQEKADKMGFRPRCWYKPKTTAHHFSS